MVSALSQTPDSPLPQPQDSPLPQKPKKKLECPWPSHQNEEGETMYLGNNIDTEPGLLKVVALGVLYGAGGAFIANRAESSFPESAYLADPTILSTGAFYISSVNTGGPRAQQPTLGSFVNRVAFGVALAGSYYAVRASNTWARVFQGA